MSPNRKIRPIEEMNTTLAPYRKKGKKIVLCHGIFDLLHIGHIRFFEQARAMGNILVVVLLPDRYVTKDPNRTSFEENLRAEAIASLNCVDFVTIGSHSTVEEPLRLLRPDIYAKGSEYNASNSSFMEEIEKEKQVAKEIGARIVFTEDISFGSTNLINRYLTNLPSEISEYLDLFRRRYSYEEVMQVVERMSSLKVLIIGDTILDDYQYCDVIGKSSKDPALAMKYSSNDLFAGGVLAVANHVANFAESVHLVTVLGEHDRHEEFIRSQLKANITPDFLIQPNAPTLIKRRFIDGYTVTKLFEVYIMDDSGLPPAMDNDLCRRIKEYMSGYDLVLASDFGHGAISSGMVETLALNAPYLAVNTQANAGNRGFNTISRYPKADYACIAEHELRLETRLKDGNIWPMMNSLAKKLSCSQFVVTRGRKGCAVYNSNGSFVQVPAFAQNIVDRVGAGDAFLSVSSLAAAQGVPSEIMGFLGNIVGALAVEIMGNKKSIDKESVQKHIASLMK